MKTTRIMLLAAVLLGALPVMGSAATSISAGLHIGPSGHARVDVGFFYDDLASYGHWIQRPRYGWVWTPRVAVATWRPYQDGHWVWTDLGWTWVSDEPFGWATYHYGRWYDDPDYGWEWVPGDEWAPAWVDWHAGDDYVGWAPLPPTIDFRPGVFLNVALAPEDFIFVPSRRFLEPRIAAFAVPRWQCGQIYRGTRNFTRYDRFNNQIVNTGFPVNRVQQWTGRRVPRYQVADLGWNERHRGARLAQNRLALFRPQVERARVAPPTARPLARRAVLAGAAAAKVVSAHHAFRTAEARRQPQGVVRQQGRGQRQVLAQQQLQARQQQRLKGQQRPQVQAQARNLRREGQAQRQLQAKQQQQARQQLRSQRRQLQTAQQRGRVQQQQARVERQTQMRHQQQARQMERLQSQQRQRAQQEARVQQQQGRAQRQQQLQARQQERFQHQRQQQAQTQARMQQQQARQQERSQRQAQVQQQRPQRQFQQAQQQARQQARQQGRPPQQQGNQGQGGNHRRQRPERPPQ